MRRRSSPIAYPSALAGAWRGASAAGAGLVAGVLSAWGVALHEDVPGGPLATAAVVGAVVAGLAWRRLPVAARCLRFQADAWHVSADSTPSLSPSTRRGRPTIAIDAGRWMLVRFDVDGDGDVDGVGDGATGRRRPLWLPLAAASDEAAWPPLRLALWTGVPSA